MRLLTDGPLDVSPIEGGEERQGDVAGDDAGCDETLESMVARNGASQPSAHRALRYPAQSGDVEATQSSLRHLRSQDDREAFHAGIIPYAESHVKRLLPEAEPGRWNSSRPMARRQINMARLQAAKIRAGIDTDKELARRVGVSPSRIIAWRNGEVPGAQIMGRLCVALDVSREYLLDEPIPPPSKLLRLYGYDLEAHLLQTIDDLSAADRRRLFDKIDGWVEALTDAPRNGSRGESLGGDPGPHGNTIYRE